MNKCEICKNVEAQIACNGIDLCDPCLGWSVRTELEAGQADTGLKIALNRIGGIVLDAEAVERASNTDLIRRVTDDGTVYLTTTPKGLELYEVPESEDD